VPSSVTRHTFDNGITVLLQPRQTSAAVSIEGTLPFGAFLDQESTLGITHLVSSMLRRGTLTRSFQQINATLDSVGASLALWAGRDELSIAGRCLGDDLGMLIEIMADMLQAPAFPEIELRRLRGQVLTQMAEMERDTGYRAHQAFIESLYPAGHAYARPLAGRPETVASLSSEDLATLYRERFHPEGMILAVVGALEPEAVL